MTTTRDQLVSEITKLGYQIETVLDNLDLMPACKKDTQWHRDRLEALKDLSAQRKTREAQLEVMDAPTGPTPDGWDEISADDEPTVIVRVDTKPYRRKHGCEPSGRFLWTFRFGGTRLYFSMRGEYEVCLSEAIRRAKDKGVGSLSVSSVVYGQDDGV